MIFVLNIYRVTYISKDYLKRGVGVLNEKTNCLVGGLRMRNMKFNHF